MGSRLPLWNWFCNLAKHSSNSVSNWQSMVIIRFSCCWYWQPCSSRNRWHGPSGNLLNYSWNCSVAPTFRTWSTCDQSFLAPHYAIKPTHILPTNNHWAPLAAQRSWASVYGQMIKLLERSGFENGGPDTRPILREIERRCSSCQVYDQKSRCFKISLKDDKGFNHTVDSDIFYVDSKLILNIVDEATNFHFAKLLEEISSEPLWRPGRLCWSPVYLGPPDVIAYDSEKNFMTSAFQANADMSHIWTKSLPVESANSMTIVERYHAPIRRALNTIYKEAKDIEQGVALQMAVKAINDSVGSNGLVPTLLVFGALPRPGLLTYRPIPSTL